MLARRGCGLGGGVKGSAAGGARVTRLSAGALLPILVSSSRTPSPAGGHEALPKEEDAGLEDRGGT